MSIPTQVGVNIVNLNVFEKACNECGYETVMNTENDSLEISKNNLYRKTTVTWDENKKSYVINTDSDDTKKIQNEIFPMYSAFQIENDLSENHNFDFSNMSMTRKINNDIVLEFDAIIQ